MHTYVRCIYSIAFLLALTGPVTVRGQELSYKHYSVRDGLPGSTIYHSLQDKDGFIWFATNQGVSRFDGRNFRNFSRQHGLPDNEVMRLYLDSKNRVWCTTFVGIPAVFHNDSIIRFDDCPNVQGIQEDTRNGMIYLTGNNISQGDTSYFLYQAINTPGRWTFNKTVRRVSDGWPMLKAYSDDLSLYFESQGEHHCIVAIKTKTSEQRYPLYMYHQSPFASPGFLDMDENQHGVAFCTLDTLYYADKHKLHPILSASSLSLRANLASLFCENDSTLWLCTRHLGITRIRNFLKPNTTIESFFSNTFCTSIMKDQENGYWITTYTDGVYYLPNLSFHTVASPLETNNTDVRSIGNLGNNIIAAGFAGGNILFINNTTLHAEQPSCWKPPEKNRLVLDIKAMAPNLFLVACDDGLYAIENTNKISPVETGLSVKGLFLDRNNTFVTASSWGIRATNLKTGEYSQEFSGRTTCITGMNGFYYWGTLHGVYTNNHNTAQYLGKKYPALSGIISYLTAAKDSALWACTQEGLVILKNENITRINTENGIPSNNCKHVWFDKNTAWVSTNQGIARIEYHWKGSRLIYTVSNITEEDGLITNDVNQTTTDERYLWAATAQGISFFSKHYVSQSVHNPLINISRIVSGGIPHPPADTIRLHYPNNKLQIELSGISYHSGRNISYEYRLREVDNHWSKLTNNAIEFPTLPFGTFVFEVRTVDRWGKKSTEPKRILIIHTAPFWKSNAFAITMYLVTAVMMSLVFYTLHRINHRKKEHEYALRKKMHDLEMKALRAQMNPHFIFNCLTSIQYHIMRADIRSATNYLHKFSTLIRRTLQHSTSSSILLQEELKILTLYLELEKLRLGDRMEYSVNVSADLKTESLFVPSMIVQPYVENAIKHGVSPLKDRTGIINISFERNHEYIECTIEDNGPGIHNLAEQRITLISNDHVSLGTAITAHRINTLNVIRQKKIKLEIINKSDRHIQSTGTIILLSFPILND